MEGGRGGGRGGAQFRRHVWVLSASFGQSQLLKLLLLLLLSDLEAELMRPGNLESIARPQAGARGVGKGALR